MTSIGDAPYSKPAISSAPAHRSPFAARTIKAVFIQLFDDSRVGDRIAVGLLLRDHLITCANRRS